MLLTILRRLPGWLGLVSYVMLFACFLAQRARATEAATQVPWLRPSKTQALPVRAVHRDFYDQGARTIAEDYWPCLASQPAYTAPDLTTGDGTEVFYWYDSLDRELAAGPASGGAADAGGCLISPSLTTGRIVSVSDRGSKTMMGYDGRGRAQCMSKHMAPPGAASEALATRYASRTYTQTLSFDAADRPTTATTGAQVVLGTSGASSVTTSYSRRGVVDHVTSSYGDLVTSIARAADGPIGAITYGDLAATSTAFMYDARRRVSSVMTTRGPPATWPTGGSPTVYQHTLEDTTFQYDLADNPTQIGDLRNPAEWPAGALPVNRTIAYDDLYRATSMTYASPTGYGPDTWVDPFLAEDTGTTTDPRLAQPSPHASFTSRVQSQTVAYDWLGNTTQSGDDVGAFYDRSLGTITNGGSGAGPYQLTGASGGTSPLQGSLTTAYDGAGNLTGMTVSRPNAPCVPTGASCSQRFAYDWDEVGRLTRARRWDGASLGALTTALPTATPAADLSYAYDASDARTLKTALDDAGNQANTVYVYDDLELRRAAWNGTDYDDTVDTEVPYLFSHGVRLARVEYSTTDPSPGAHVILELQDHLGSASIAIDQGTSELVERSTYLGYGGADSDYRPATWSGFREDYRFTGKEEDVEVGLDYFGKRFYAPLLGRWVSADPLAVHSPGSADLNVYAYVHGAVLRAVDPTGLQAAADARSDRKAADLAHPDDPGAADKEFAQLQQAGGRGGLIGLAAVGCLAAPTLCRVVGLVSVLGQASNHDEAAAAVGTLVVGEAVGRVVGEAFSAAAATVETETAPLGAARTTPQPPETKAGGFPIPTGAPKPSATELSRAPQVPTVGAGVSAQGPRLVPNDPGYLIIDGTHRAAAALRLGKTSILAELSANDKLIETLEVPVLELRSSKSVLDLSGKGAARWRRALDETSNGQSGPIKIQRQNGGTPIDQVRLLRPRDTE